MITKFEIDGRLEMEQAQILRFDERMKVESKKKDYNGDIILIINAATLYNTILRLSSDMEQKIKEVETIKLENETLKAKAKEIDKCEKVYIRKGIIKQFCILKHLFELNRPTSLNQLFIALSANEQFSKAYKGKSKQTIIGSLKTLIKLDYVKKIERGLYQLTQKGSTFLSSIDKERFVRYA